MLLENKRVVLGICGGIAAFKAAHIAASCVSAVLKSNAL